MANLTMKAEIDHVRITVAEPEKLPLTGKALLTVLDSPEHRMGTRSGTAGHDAEQGGHGLAIEREALNEWDERERKQWDNR